jgi:CysZ protein
MRFVYLQHPKLARYWVFPVLITGLALVAVFAGAGSYYDDLGDAVWSLFPESWNEATGWIGGLLTALRWLIELIAGLLIMLLTGELAPPFSLRRMMADLVRSVRLELLKVLVYVAVVGPMFLASFFIPGLGQVISLIGFALTAVYLGIDYVDWPAARRNWSVGDRVSFTRRQLPAVAGFGTGVWLLLFIPLINLLFMPAAVAGGTMLFIALQQTPPPTQSP